MFDLTQEIFDPGSLLPHPMPLSPQEWQAYSVRALAHLLDQFQPAQFDDGCLRDALERYALGLQALHEFLRTRALTNGMDYTSFLVTAAFLCEMGANVYHTID